jgi:hypothetical protein
MRNRTRWAVTFATASAVVGGTFLVPAVANADPELPPTTAEELLADLASAEERPFSGTVVHTADLGLPELPQGGGSTGELSTLLAGSTTLRLWSDGPERSRIAVMGALAETDVVRNGDEGWLWRSDEGTAYRADLSQLPEEPAEGEDDAAAPGVVGPDGATDPATAARSALAALDPTTEVTLDGTTTVAGRDAYELVLTPRAQESLVGQVRLAVDAETSYPLRAQVIARGAGEPAFETGFTSISFTAPDEEVFAFEPPPGTTVEEVDPEAFTGTGGHQDGAPEGAAHDGQQPTVVGEGWASVVVLRDAAGALDPAAAGGQGGQGGGDEGGAEIGSAILAGFQPVQGDFGSGRVLSTSLVSVLALDDGRVLMGAVAPEVLERAALDPAATP